MEDNLGSSVDKILRIDKDEEHEGSAIKAADKTLPPGTIRHMVTASETITHLCIKFDMTKSELCSLNRIVNANVVIPGQEILVKDPKNAAAYVPPKAINFRKPEAQTTPKMNNLPSESSSPQSVQFANNTMFRVKSLFLTLDKGIVPGTLEGSCDYIRFTPTDNPIVEEFGKDVFTLFFEYEDLLSPCTQRSPPSLRTKPDISPGYAAHREEAEVQSVDGNPQPIFLQIRVRLVYGVEPTPDTTAVYWFAIGPQWIDRVYNIASDAAKLQEVEPWHFLQGAEVTTSGQSILSAAEPEEATLRDPSRLLKEFSIAALKKELPARYRYAEWFLAFSTYEHGLSINNMYRTLRKVQEKPCVTVIRDSKGHIFGCYSTEAWKYSKETDNHYYGAGECFVFMLKPELQFFRWTHANSLFMCSTEKELMLGGGSGAAAIWLDGDLTIGCSKPSKTFNNTCLASSEDFKVEGIEVWILENHDW